METKLLKQIRKQQKLTQLEIKTTTAILIAQALQTTVEELFPLSQRNSSENTNSINKE